MAVSRRRILDNHHIYLEKVPVNFHELYLPKLAWVASEKSYQLHVEQSKYFPGNDLSNEKTGCLGYIRDYTTQ